MSRQSRCLAQAPAEGLCSHLIPHETLAPLDGQDWAESEDRLATLLPVLPPGALRLGLRLNGTLLSLDVLLVLRYLPRSSLIALIRTYVVAGRKRMAVLASGMRIAVGDITPWVDGTTVVLLVLRAGVVLRPAVAVLIIERNLLVARPCGWGRRAPDSAPHECGIGRVINSRVAHRSTSGTWCLPLALAAMVVVRGKEAVEAGMDSDV